LRGALTGQRLPVEWKTRRLDEVCEGVFDCPHSTPELTSDGPLVVRTQDIRSGVLRSEAAGRVSEETYRERIKRAEPRHGDLLYSREGTYFGVAAEVPRESRLCLGQRMVLIRPDQRSLDFRFLRYWLNSPFMASHTEGSRDGSVAERLNLPTIRSLPVPVPPLDEQRAIGSVLGALDDKTEMNRRMSETLEAMARALFKSWFVDFDPVRAKSEGSSPCLGNPVAELFPGALERSDRGAIPTGWRWTPVAELSNVFGGSTPRTEEEAYWRGGDIFWATPKDMAPLSSAILLETERRITPRGLEQIGSGLLPRGTVLMSSRAPIGYLAITEVSLAVNQGIVAMVPRPGVPSTYLLRWAEQAQEEIVSRANGSTFLEISKGNFRLIPVLDPSPEVLAAFGRIADPLHERTVILERESRTLAALRDTLLPKLISGELRIPDAERIVNKAI
jgi:type I restriction enzyme S subunit